MTDKAILDPRGEPIPAKTIDTVRKGGRIRAGLNGSAAQFFPYDAAQWQTAEMGEWFPGIRSPDSEINIYRDRMVARQRDLVRNDGWVAGSVDRIVDNTIGSQYRLMAKPDYRALRALYPNAKFDEQWASEYQRLAEALWRVYSEDLGRYNDVSRQLTVAQQFRLALRHKLIDGESLMLSYWLPDRIAIGKARFATAYLVIDPDRLSNPMQMVDTKYFRSGVEIDDEGAPIAYHVRRAHQNDWYNAVESMEWERIEREDFDGWQRVIHDFDRGRAGQSRGVSVFAPVLGRLKMLARYYGVELQAATIASVFGTYVTSPYDEVMVQDALETENASFGWYQQFRSDWSERKPAMLDGARIPALAPGEKIETVSAERPTSNFSPFTHEMLRSLAAVLGVSAEQITQDYSETNYSSARAAIVEAEKTFNRRASDFMINTATGVYAGVLHEAHERGLMDDVLPRNAPPFIEARTSYARSRFLGAAKGWVDPTAERQGAILGLDAGFSTLEEECAAQGMDWEENIEQRKREVARFAEAGLPLPQWAGQVVKSQGAPAQSTIAPPVAT